jgi:hypothetical protein
MRFSPFSENINVFNILAIKVLEEWVPVVIKLTIVIPTREDMDRSFLGEPGKKDEAISKIVHILKNIQTWLNICTYSITFLKRIL